MQTQQTRRTRIGKHLRRNVVAYIALMLAVTMSPLPSWAAGKIGTKDIKNGAVTAKKIKNNAVKSSKIKDGSVTKADLNAAARGFTSINLVKESAAVGASPAQTTVSVYCPDGQVAIGGGGYSTAGIVFGPFTGGQVIKSFPIVEGTFLGNPANFAASNGAEAEGWSTTVQNTSDDAGTAFGYAVCAVK